MSFPGICTSLTNKATKLQNSVKGVYLVQAITDKLFYVLKSFLLLRDVVQMKQPQLPDWLFYFQPEISWAQIDAEESTAALGHAGNPELWRCAGFAVNAQINPKSQAFGAARAAVALADTLANTSKVCGAEQVTVTSCRAALSDHTVPCPTPKHTAPSESPLNNKNGSSGHL